MAEHRNDQTRDTQIIVKQCRTVTKGRDSKGDEYRMYQLIATRLNGTPIMQNLRSFEEMPVDEPLDVSVTPFVSEQYGTSYTVRRRGQTKVQRELDAVKVRLRIVEEYLGIQADGTPPISEQQPTMPPPLQ